MDHYLTVGARDPREAVIFYDAVLSEIGWSRHADVAGWSCYSRGGTGNGVVLFVGTPFDQAPAGAGNGQMTGFIATSRAQVDAFHVAALRTGGACAGTPGSDRIMAPASMLPMCVIRPATSCRRCTPPAEYLSRKSKKSVGSSVPTCP